MHPFSWHKAIPQDPRKIDKMILMESYIPEIRLLGVGVLSQASGTPFTLPDSSKDAFMARMKLDSSVLHVLLEGEFF